MPVRIASRTCVIAGVDTYPAEIEGRVVGASGAKCVVFGIADQGWRQALVAAVELMPDAALDVQASAPFRWAAPDCMAPPKRAFVQRAAGASCSV